MVQPSGRVCYLDPSLRIYLRSSPIVCAFDAITIIVRFVIYIRRGLSPPTAAKKVMFARRRDIKDPETGHRALEQIMFWRFVWFVVGVLPQVIKLMACSGLPWTKLWAWFYLVSFIIVEVMETLAKFAKERDPPEDYSRDLWIDFFDLACGAVAVLLQLFLLAWIDLAEKPPDHIVHTKWLTRFYRLGAHFVAFLIQFSFGGLVMALDTGAPMESPNLRWGGFVMTMLLIFCIQLVGFEGHHFSYLYFMFSIIISFFAWLLYFIPPVKTHVLRCRGAGFLNVLAFDFFSRVLCLSLFWYAKHYNPTGTFKPQWAEVLG
jgi:hypothetical protein